MRVTIIGAGVVGATTAYFAARQGHDVTLIERNPAPAQETSFANAGQLSYSYTDTLADPGLLARIPGMLLGHDISMRIAIDLPLLSWGVRFLMQCTRKRSDDNTVRLLQMAQRSAAALDTLLSDLPIEFQHRRAGKLLLTASNEKLAGLQRRAALKVRHGARVDILDAAECLKLEPALDSWSSRIAGAAYSQGDDAGDARLFTQELCKRLSATARCRIVTGVAVERLLRHRDRVIGVETDRATLESDAVVICAGIGTRALLRDVGLSVSIYPLKGYSVTAEPGPRPPRVSLTDVDRRIVFTNFAGRMRLAGLADMAGVDTSVDSGRVRDLVRLGREGMPEAMNFAAPFESWAGLRPATPSGLPIIGPTRLRGLHLNVGHGGLGWTLACGSAEMLATQLAN